MTYKTKEYVDYALASISSRFLASIIDGLILGAITGILVGSSRNAGGLGASFAIGMLYHWYFLTRKNGQTIGSLIMKIRVVKSTGEPLTDVDAILRWGTSGRCGTTSARRGTIKWPALMWCRLRPVTNPLEPHHKNGRGIWLLPFDSPC